jgi:hypothetical protein
MKPTIITLTLALGATAILHIKRDDDSANAVDGDHVLTFTFLFILNCCVRQHRSELRARS